MGFPAKEIRMGGTWAFIFTEVGQILIVKVNPISGLLFCLKDFGTYQLNKKNGLICGRGRVSFYDQRMMNPIDVSAFSRLTDVLKQKNMESLSDRQLTLLVPTLKPKTGIDNLARDFKALGLKETDAILQVAEEKVLQNAIKEQTELKASFGTEICDFLSDFYFVDKIAHKSLRFKVIEDSDFKMKRSNRVIEWALFQRTGFSRHVALVIIDNRVLDIVPAKTEVRLMEDGTAKTFVLTKEYGDFEIEGNRNIYRHKKTSVHIVQVKTVKEESQ